MTQLAVLCGAIGLSAWTTTPISYAAGGTNDKTTADRDQVPTRSATDIRAAAVKFRKEFGLPYDDAALAAANAAPHPDSQHRFGTALTADEYAAQLQRTQWVDAAGPLVAVIDSHQDELGGLWIDQEHDGAFIVMTLPTTPATTKAAVLAATPVGAPVRFQETRFSRFALESALATVTQQMGDATNPGGPSPDNAIIQLRNQGFSVLTASLDEKGNQVAIGLESLPDARRDELARAWDTFVVRGALPTRILLRFESSGRPVPQESRSNSPGHMKGGLRIDGPTSPGATNYCTSNLTASGGLQMTASHCFAQDGRQVTHFGNPVGPIAWDGWANLSDADVQAFQLPRGGYVSPNMLAAFPCSDGVNTCQQIDTAGAAANPIQTSMACMGGVADYWITCSQVQSLDTTATYLETWKGSVTFRNLVSAAYTCNSGDSGAVVGNGANVYGVHSGTNGSSCLFSRITNALRNMGNRSLVTGTPGVPASWTMLQTSYSLRCMDVKYNASTNGTPVWQWPCNAGVAQQWTFIPVGTMNGCCDLYYEIKRSALSSKCLDLDIGEWSGGNGAKIQEWDCNGWSNQKWKTQRFGALDRSQFRIISQYNSRCIDMDLNTNGDGGRLQVWDCLGTDASPQVNQLWRIY